MNAMMFPMFPAVKRVELQAPPLELVVCQIKFPTILALTADKPPEELQRRFADTYPMAQRKRAVVGIETDEQRAFVPAGSTWCFEDRESTHTVTLHHDALTLESKRYCRFTDFIDRFNKLVDTVRQQYPIAMRTRLGLRYVDRISLATNPKLRSEWWKSIQSDFLPIRRERSNEVQQQVKLETRLHVNGTFLTVRSMFVDSGFPGFQNDELILDFDCYNSQRENLEDFNDVLSMYKDVCYRAFRWAIGGLINDFEQEE